MLPDVNVCFVSVKRSATQLAFLRKVRLNHVVSHAQWIGVHVFLKQNHHVLMNVKKIRKKHIFNFILFSGLL